MCRNLFSLMLSLNLKIQQTQLFIKITKQSDHTIAPMLKRINHICSVIQLTKQFLPDYRLTISLQFG